MSGIIQFGNCINQCIGLIHYKHIEDSVLAGRSDFLIALMQFAEANNAIVLGDEALIQAGMETVPLAMRFIIWLTPPALAAAIKFGPFDQGTAHTAAIFVQNQIGLLCQIAGSASAVALIYFGNPLFGGASLAILGIGFMDRQGLLPERVRHIVHDVSPFILGTIGIISGDIFNTIAAFINLGCYALDFYSSYLQRQQNEAIASIREIPEGGLTLDICHQIFDERLSLTVNREHVHYSAMPPIPHRNIDELNEMFERIVWNERNIRTLRGKLRQDLRFRELIGNPDERDDREIIEFAKSSMRNFISSVQRRFIPSGEPRDYQRMEDYLKVIAEVLAGENNEVVRSDALLRLAVEGGEYCGPGKFEATESVYASLIGGITDLPLRKKFLNCLQDKRGILMQEFYPQAGSNYLWFDWNDVHIYNQGLNLFGNNLGLRRSGAENDSSALVEPIFRLVFSAHIAVFEEFFWGQYPHRMVEAIQEAVGSSLLPRPEIYDWWRNWINNLPIETSRKEALIEKLGYGMIFDEQMEIEVVNHENNSRRTVINPKIINAMFFDMGLM